ncbi:MAG: CRISPR-associated endonuclease Cas2 [Candidatus Helarchaeota archaeon]
MKLLAIYDVPQEHDDKRLKIAQILKNHGLKRIEYSVFFGNTTIDLMETLAMRLYNVVKNTPADVRLFPICKNCLDKAIIVKQNNFGFDFDFDLNGIKQFVGF